MKFQRISSVFLFIFILLVCPKLFAQNLDSNQELSPVCQGVKDKLTILFFSSDGRFARGGFDYDFVRPGPKGQLMLNPMLLREGAAKITLLNLSQEEQLCIRDYQRIQLEGERLAAELPKMLSARRAQMQKATEDNTIVAGGDSAYEKSRSEVAPKKPVSSSRSSSESY